MFTSTVSPKGAIVIPNEIRKKYGIEPGCKVQILEFDKRLELFIVPKDVIKYARGCLKGGNKTALEMLKEDREEDRKHEVFLLKTFSKNMDLKDE